MGKYMRKSKLTGDVVREVPPPATATPAGTLGVRTRSRTLALRKFNSASSPPLPPPSPSSLCYLQLRSRRLQKPAAFASKEKLPKPHKAREEPPCEAEFSLGENCLDSDPPRERSTKETTPCTPIRDSNATRESTLCTPARKTCSTSVIVCTDAQRKIPPASELEEFFAAAERQQQRWFIEKYNFDVVNDCPLPGQYEWVKIVPCAAFCSSRVNPSNLA